MQCLFQKNLEIPPRQKKNIHHRIVLILHEAEIRKALEINVTDVSVKAFRNDVMRRLFRYSLSR